VTTELTHQMLQALSTTYTYLGAEKYNEVAAIGGGKWVWRVKDHHFGDFFAAYTGTLEDCEALKRAYDQPAKDFPF
jgi:hypothetical protein